MGKTKRNAGLQRRTVPAGREEEGAAADLDQAVLDTITQQIRFQVRSSLSKAWFAIADREDLEQELFLHVLIRLPQFDASRARLSTFIARIIRNKLSNLLAGMPAPCNGHARPVSLYDEVAQENGGEPFTRWETLAPEDDRRLHAGARLNGTEHRDLQIDLGDGLAALPPAKRECCELRGTCTVTEVAARRGVNRNTVHEALCAARAELRKRGLTIYLPRTPSPVDAHADHPTQECSR